MSTRTIKNAGLKGVEIGAEMPDASITKLLGHYTYDTIIEEGGYSWRAMVINHPSGRVLVESDFSNQDIINRIQIMATDLRYQRKISVGSTVADLDQLAGPWYITHIPAYHRVDLTVQGLHFLISDDFIDSDNEDAPKRTDIPRGSEILSIVLM